jgi:hypothetical protein
MVNCAMPKKDLNQIAANIVSDSGKTKRQGWTPGHRLF